MAFPFQKTTSALLALLVVFSMSLFSLASAFSAGPFMPPHNFEGCRELILTGPRAKISDKLTLWENGNACGKYFKVTCNARVDRGPGPCKEGDPSVVVRVAGICRDCPADILLVHESFAEIVKRKEITHNIQVNIEHQ